MTRAEHAFDLAAYHLDEAVEGLTFDRFDWALEEAARGVAWTLQALSPHPEVAPDLPAKGEMPTPPQLLALLEDSSSSPEAAALVAALELAHSSLAEVTELVRRRTLVAQVVFSACQLLDQSAEGLGLCEPSVGYGGSVPRLADANPVPPRRGVGRRDLLRFIAAGGALSLAACSRAEPAQPAEGSNTEAAVGPLEPSVPAAVAGTTTSLDQMQWPTSDPFLFCAYHVDHYPVANAEMGPAASLEGRVIGRDFAGVDGWNMYHGEAVPGFPRHPHRGFETVTVVQKGRLDHADSMGATARYGDGDVQWLTAGGGIQHAEMFPLLNTEAENPAELFQIWLNLPAADKMVPSHFTMLWHEDIPVVTVTDDAGLETKLTVVAGAYAEHAPPSPPPDSWGSKPHSDLAIWKIHMQAGARFELPTVSEGTARSVYVHVGAGARVAETEVVNLNRVELEGHGAAELVAGSEDVEILLLQGKPIGEPVARRGPFVMNTQAEIRQAYSDYQSTGFGGWPWPDNAPVHARTQRRFALRADGVREEPG